MTRERLTKPIAPLQRAPDAAPKARASSRPAPLARLPRTLEVKPVSPAQLELQRAQQLEVQRLANLEGQRAAIQRAHDDRFTQARASQTAWHARGTKTLGVQRAVAEHARNARDASHTRASFIAQRSSENFETLVAQRLEAEARPALPVVQRQADLTLSHVADHFGSKAAVQLARDPDRLSSYAGFKNAGAGLVKNFRTPGSSHTMPELASAIQRFRDPMQRAAVESAAYAAFGSHPTYPKQLQRALEQRDSQLEVQREAWQRELEPVAQRQALEEASGEGAAQQIESARGSGQPLPAGVRAMLEAKWNTDLSKVRVHTDSRSSQISKKLNAKALTTGQDIFFGASTFNPTSLEGLQLIAHEAWHTVQQAQGLVQAGVDRDKGLELEARGKGAELSSRDVQTASSAAATSSSGKESKAKRATRTASPTSGTPSTTRGSRTSKTVQRSITPAPTSLTATTTRVTGNLEGLASSAPIFGTPVQRAADGTVIQRAWWNPFDWAVEGAKWLGASFMHGLEWMGEKAAKVFMEVFAAAAKPFGATGKLVLEAIRNIGKPLLSILENPGRFATNLIQGVKQGFMGFATNAPKHLTGVLGSFLGGKGLSLTFPTKLEPMPILMAFITTLDLGWDSIKAKIADQLGPKGHQALALAEKSVPIVKQLRGGLHNSSEFTKEVLPTLKTQAVDGVKTAAQEGLIRAGINALLKLIPGAGTVMAIFDTVRVLIERAKDISSLVQNVMGAFGAIAGGNVSSAAVAVERSLVGGIGIALNFVAKLTKIDTFIARVHGIIGKVTTKISSVMKPLIAKAVKLVRPLLNKLGGKGGQETDSRTAAQKQAAVNNAAKDADVFMKAADATSESVKAKLPALKKKYQLNTIELNEEKDGESHVTATINPTAVTPSRRLKKKEHREFYPENMDVKPTADGVLITYTTRAGKNFQVTVGRSGHVTQAQGFDLDLTKLGRGVTEDPANKEKNVGQNSAHVIANWFGGSGYKKSLNLIATSDHFNKVVMGNAEDRIVAWVKTAKIDKFNLNVSVDWGTVKEEDAMNRIIEQAGLLSGLTGQELQKSKQEILKRLSNFKAILKAVEDVEYATNGVDFDGKTKTLRPINTGKDTWLK